ncbi:MAG TPA: vitamin B12-dependent ribonucleotide reductase [Candidatus Saccharimonadales bacterium]|nr:vitamin B12-dependent ribonucleotide reductase [Candidatus Saccharimonadales bacterium]
MAEVTEKTSAARPAPASTPDAADGRTASAQQQKRQAQGLAFQRHFTQSGVSPYDKLTWEFRTASIVDSKGNVIFEQKDVEVPKDWSMTATNIVASKYLHGQIGTEERETGVRQLVSRVAETIRDWGFKDGYFRSKEDANIFHDELVHMLLNQYAAFNSPVWFNVGCDRSEPNSDAQNWHWSPESARIEFGVTGYSYPQCSACFINSVHDSLDSILTLAKTEGMLFKWGSGTGTNLSPLRGSMEVLSGGGQASGPLSFMKGFDAFAGVIKSGGKTRRAAKMVILNIDHPDIEQFIECKQKEEAKAFALATVGYDASGPDSEAYSSIFFQNANNSIRVTDEFMEAVVEDKEFTTLSVRERNPVQTFKARDLLNKIAKATWECGDPGMQYDTTINRWHTSKNTSRINASNPCSEYMFLDDSACNLSSLNLVKFAPTGVFDVESYKHAVDILITAQEILVDHSGYPTEAIGRNSHDYRPLGLGYANLGALLMATGLPYDSDAGRDYAACLTAIMCGEAYVQSSRIAELCPTLHSATELTATVEHTDGACPGYFINREPFLEVIQMHRASVAKISRANVPASLLEASQTAWDKALSHGEKFGYRNAQVTVLAPTGTIGFMMDCDTTGVEPDLALVKFKKLVGGGMMKIVNNTVPEALFKLGYTPEQADAIVSYIDKSGTIEGAPQLNPEHLPVFDCAFKPAKGTRSIHPKGHLKMMAAVQPFISGAISKTINMPHEATIEEIADAYVEAWKLGLKAVAIYRDGSKQNQVLTTKQDAAKKSAVVVAEEEDLEGPPSARRHKLPDQRFSVTHKFKVGSHEGYLTVGLYPNGRPGELFITMAKEGSTVSGLMDSFACAVSIALQHGVPLRLLVNKFAHTRFEPSGWTQNPEIGYANSIMDYIFRWLDLRFLTGEQQSLFDDLRPHTSGHLAATPVSPAIAVSTQASLYESGTPQGSKSQHAADALSELVDMGDAPSCHVCGAIMTRNGSCYRCQSCGSTSGCS